MAVHVFNASITIHTTSPYHLRASASEVHADGSAGGPARALVFSTKVVDGTAAVLAEGVTIGEAACSFVVEGNVKADGPLNVEVVFILQYSKIILFFFVNTFDKQQC